jgi:hypothetical protein
LTINAAKNTDQQPRKIDGLKDVGRYPAIFGVELRPMAPSKVHSFMNVYQLLEISPNISQPCCQRPTSVDDPSPLQVKRNVIAAAPTTVAHALHHNDAH